MEKSMGNLQLILNAARQHYRDEQWWRSVPGPAYFESNLEKAKNRAKLGEAIDQLEKQLPEIAKRFDEPSPYDELANKVCSELKENFFRFVNTGEAVNEYLVHLDHCQKCHEAVETAFDRQAKALEALGRHLRG